MQRTLTIAHLTFLEARRRWIVPAALICSALFLLVYGVALHFIAQKFGRAGLVQAQVQVQFITIAGLYVANFLTIAVAVLLAVDTLSGEIASGVMQTIASKPIRRSEIVLGKWLTFLAMSAAYLVITGGGVVAIVLWTTGHAQPHLLRALPLMLLGAGVMLSISLAGGARLSTVTNGIVAFGFYGIAFIGGWVEQIAAFTSNETARYVGTAISLLSPVDALWRRAAYELMPPLTRGLQLTPFGSAVVPSNGMIVWALGFAAVALAIGIAEFRRRPL